MTQGTPFDVAIVGGGGCGLGVLVQLLEKSTVEMRVALFEREESVGPGLAYSEACVGTRINMHASSMSLYASDPGRFARWMRENPSDASVSGGNVFPFRDHFGRYLKSEMANAVQLAQAKGIELKVYKVEVTDIQRDTTGWTFHTADSETVQAVKAVLALGNHIRQLNKHLNGKPLYFDRPWPNSRLLEIPRSASVAILGSRLTAIDEALFLAQHGHTGQIYLMSRTGQLPKVQGGSKKYEHVYSLYNLARELEQSPEHAILKIAGHIHDEIQSVSSKNANLKRIRVSKEDDLISQFRSDVEMAQQDEVPILRVLKETAPMSERYWNCLSNATKEVFLKEYMSTWISHRAPMPLQTGERLLGLLESGQIRVVRTDSHTPISHTDGGFSIPVTLPEGVIRVDSLVEATGMEFDITRIETPLLRNLLARKILIPHVAGGIDVDFRTLQAQKNLYCLGSLTRGVHFHTTALDRNVAHAEWIADDILGLSPRKSLHIALFVGSDLFSQLIVSQIVPRLLGAGHVPFIYLPISRNNKRNAPFEMRELEFYETTLLQDTIIPHLGSDLSNAGQFMTMRQLRQRYGILIQSIPDVNDSEFIHSLSSNHIDIGYGIRSPQRFGADIAQSFKSRQGLFNLHPGLLPEYDGRMPTLRAMANREANFGYSLQDIQQGLYTATRVDIRTHPIDYSKAMLNNTDAVWQEGAHMLFAHTERVARGHTPAAQPQDKHASKYYTVPTRDELAAFRAQGLRLVDPDAIKQTMLAAFAPAGHAAAADALRAAIDAACKAWQEETLLQGMRDILALKQHVVREEIVELSAAADVAVEEVSAATHMSQVAKSRRRATFAGGYAPRLTVQVDALAKGHWGVDGWNALHSPRDVVSVQALGKVGL